LAHGVDKECHALRFKNLSMTESRQQRRAKERSAGKNPRSEPEKASPARATTAAKPSWTPRAKAHAAAAVLCAVAAGLIIFSETVAPAAGGFVLFAIAGVLILRFRGKE